MSNLRSASESSNRALSFEFGEKNVWVPFATQRRMITLRAWWFIVLTFSQKSMSIGVSVSKKSACDEQIERPAKHCGCVVPSSESAYVIAGTVPMNLL